jgi:hypothetical protein
VANGVSRRNIAETGLSADIPTHYGDAYTVNNLEMPDGTDLHDLVMSDMVVLGQRTQRDGAAVLYVLLVNEGI